MSLGISLGSKFLLQLSLPDGSLRTLPHDGVNSSMPSYLALTNTSSLYGTPAFNQAARNSTLTFNNLKRLVGYIYNPPHLNEVLLNKDTRTFKSSMYLTPNEPLQIKNTLFDKVFGEECPAELKPLKLSKTITIECLLALLLNTIHNTWAAQLPAVKAIELFDYNCGSPIRNLEAVHKVVISIPPWFSTSQRISLLHSFKLAQVPIHDIVHDYFALMHTYALQRVVSEEKFVYFFDFGHTETTVSLIHFDPKTLIAKAVDYESHIGLGVRDCVDVVMKKLKGKFITQFLAQNGKTNEEKRTKEELETIFTLQNQKYFILWWNAIHKSIEKLTTSPFVNIECQQPFGDGEDFEYKYTKDEFEKDIYPLLHQHVSKVLLRLLERTITPILTNDNTLKNVGIECVGAGCRIPVLQRILGEICIGDLNLDKNKGGLKGDGEFDQNGEKNIQNLNDLNSLKFTISHTLNPDEATARGCGFITNSLFYQENDQNNKNDQKKQHQYKYTNHPQQWEFIDETLRQRHSFPYLESLYDRLSMSPLYSRFWFNDLHQFNFFSKKDKKLSVFSHFCNKLESLCYEYENESDESILNFIQSTHDWLDEHKSGDYRQVELMIGLFEQVVGKNKIGDGNNSPQSNVEEVIDQYKQNYQKESEELDLIIKTELDCEIDLNNALYEAQNVKYDDVLANWERLGGEKAPEVQLWIGDDFFSQYSSHKISHLGAQLARPAGQSPKGSDRGTQGVGGGLTMGKNGVTTSETKIQPKTSLPVIAAKPPIKPTLPQQPMQSAPSLSLSNHHKPSLGPTPTTATPTTVTPTTTAPTPGGINKSQNLPKIEPKNNIHNHNDDLDDLFASTFITTGSLHATTPMTSPQGVISPNNVNNAVIVGGNHHDDFPIEISKKSENLVPKKTDYIFSQHSLPISPSPMTSAQSLHNTNTPPPTQPQHRLMLQKHALKHTFSLDQNEQKNHTFSLDESLILDDIINHGNDNSHLQGINSSTPQSNIVNNVIKQNNQQNNQQKIGVKSTPQTTPQNRPTQAPIATNNSTTNANQMPPLMAWHRQQPQKVDEIQHQKEKEYEKMQNNQINNNPPNVTNQTNQTTPKQQPHITARQPQQPQQRQQSSPHNNLEQSNDDGMVGSVLGAWREVMNRFQNVKDDAEINDPQRHTAIISSPLTSSHVLHVKNPNYSNDITTSPHAGHNLSLEQNEQNEQHLSQRPCQIYSQTGDCQNWNRKSCEFSHEICDGFFDGLCTAVNCDKVHLTPKAKKVLQDYYEQVMKENQ